MSELKTFGNNGLSDCVRAVNIRSLSLQRQIIEYSNSLIESIRERQSSFLEMSEGSINHDITCLVTEMFDIKTIFGHLEVFNPVVFNIINIQIE
jgi:hypothetical protein